MNATISAGPLTSQQIAQFQEDGYLFVERLLDDEEISLLVAAARADNRMQSAAMDVKDTQGRRTNLSLWNHPGDDIYGMIARSERIVGGMEQLLGDEVYHYHSKMSAKEPKVGGAWEWHQDYGYWYNNGCLWPDMASVFIAIDACTRENGCLQVLRGSHKLGRIEHGRFGEQTGADPERVKVAMERLELVYCEMTPGTGLYFHGNLLHASAANESDKPRWGLLCCYNTRHNDPYKQSHHPSYTPLAKVPHAAIKQIGAKATSSGQKFLQQDEDDTTGGNKTLRRSEKSVS
jgi:ectoine hydroxylase-related dioxygenase (phytanoyl-CoA dioxygenase family)